MARPLVAVMAGAGMCLLLTGCGQEQVAMVAGLLFGAWKLHEKVKHPVAGAITEDPVAFWQAVMAGIGLLSAVVALLMKAGKDHKRKER